MLLRDNIVRQKSLDFVSVYCPVKHSFSIGLWLEVGN